MTLFYIQDSGLPEIVLRYIVLQENGLNDIVNVLHDVVLEDVVQHDNGLHIIFLLDIFNNTLFYMILFYMIMFYKTIVIPDIVQANDLHDIGLHVLQDNCL